MIERYFVEQGIRKIELDKYLKGELERAGFTKSEIVKTPLVTRIVVNVTSPGLAIGKGGQTIRQLTETIKSRFGIENPQLEIREIAHPELDAQAVVDKMAGMVSRGFSWRSVVFKTMGSIMRAGAQGVEIVAKGVIAGKGQRKRRVRFYQGYMKKVGDQVKLVGFAKASARTKIGNIGFKVRIVRPDVIFPEKIDIRKFVIIKPETDGTESAKTEIEVETVSAKSAEAAEPEKKETKKAKVHEKKEGSEHKKAVPEKKEAKADEKDPAKTEIAEEKAEEIIENIEEAK
ncbi:MAG: 30S ribosomal protein S3 [Candidatus Micrarchaeota archaeon]